MMLGWIQGREARPASIGWNVLKTAAQTLMFWAIFLFLLPMGILTLERAAGWSGSRFDGETRRWIGVALFAAAGALGLTSGAVMAIRGRGTPLPSDCPRALVISGPYRYVRNPMAVAGLTQGIAVGIVTGSPAVIAYAMLGGPVWNFWVRPWEEADLERRFGEPYRRYRQAVRCWIPCFPAYCPDPQFSRQGNEGCSAGLDFDSDSETKPNRSRARISDVER